MWFLRLSWVLTLLCLVLGHASGRVAKAKRSVSELDVAFFPGVTPKYETALRYAELRRFLKEEQREVEREEEVVVRLLQEERDSLLDEPIEFSTQKRILKQLCDRTAMSQGPGHKADDAAHSTSTFHPQSNTGNSEVPTVGVLDATESPAQDNYYDLIIPLDKQAFEPKKHRYSTPFVTSNEQADVSTSNGDRIHELEEAFRHPSFGSIPDATITRLLDNKPRTQSTFHRAESDILHHQHDSRHSSIKEHHQDTSDSRLGEDAIPRIPHPKSTTEDQRIGDDHSARHQYLLHYLLENQKLMTPEDLSFILESEKYQMHDKDHSVSLDDHGTLDRKKKTHTVRLDEDWEEDYEYDV